MIVALSCGSVGLVCGLARPSALRQRLRLRGGAVTEAVTNGSLNEQLHPEVGLLLEG